MRRGCRAHLLARQLCSSQPPTQAPCSSWGSRQTTSGSQPSWAVISFQASTQPQPGQATTRRPRLTANVSIRSSSFFCRSLSSALSSACLAEPSVSSASTSSICGQGERLSSGRVNGQRQHGKPPAHPATDSTSATVPLPAPGAAAGYHPTRPTPTSLMSVSAWRFSSSWAPLRRSCSTGQAGVRDGAVSRQGCRCGRGKGCLGSCWLPVLSHAAAGSAASANSTPLLAAGMHARPEGAMCRAQPGPAAAGAVVQRHQPRSALLTCSFSLDTSSFSTSSSVLPSFSAITASRGLAAPKGFCGGRGGGSSGRRCQGQQRAGGARCQADDHAANCPTSGARGPWERRSAAIHRPRRAHVPRRPAALTTLA